MNQRLVSIRIFCLFLFAFILPLNVMAQEIINPEISSVDQFNKDMQKAIEMRKAGIIITFTGMGLFAAGGLTSLIMAADQPDDPDEDPWHALKDLVPVAIGGMAGIACIVVGVPLKAIGEKRINANVMLSLKMVEITSKNSIAPGVGITLRF